MDPRSAEIIAIFAQVEERLNDLKKRYGHDPNSVMKLPEVRQELEDLATEGDAYLVEDYTLVDPFGDVCDKAHVHERIASGENLFEVYERSGHDVRFYGDTAVYVSVVAIKGKRLGAEINAHFRETHTLIRNGEGWLMVACQMTFVDERHFRPKEE